MLNRLIVLEKKVKWALPWAPLLWTDREGEISWTYWWTSCSCHCKWQCHLLLLISTSSPVVMSWNRTALMPQEKRNGEEKSLFQASPANWAVQFGSLQGYLVIRDGHGRSWPWNHTWNLQGRYPLLTREHQNNIQQPQWPKARSTEGNVVTLKQHPTG